MLLSDKQIIRGIEEGSIVIEPFDKKQLGPNSYDLRLGNNFWFGDNSELSYLDPYDKESVLRYWKLKYAIETIIIQPNQTVLAHTAEFAGTNYGVVGYLRARSSLVRSGIDICKSAGMGDIGYVNRWTMEISNFSNLPVLLYPGRTVAQLLFFEVGQTLSKYHGKYKLDSFDLWKPEDMLPKLWEDDAH